MDDDIRKKLPHKLENDPGVGDGAVVPPSPPVSEIPEQEPRRWRWSFLPAFWTIASVLSMIVNIVLIIILLLLFQQLGQIQGLQSYATDETTSLLGGLYTNFVKMDQATISSTIPVDAEIPLNIVVPVQTVTEIQLAQPTVIEGAHVFIDTPVLRLNAPARVTLPATTRLSVRLDFPLTVQNSVPVHLDVPVNIPLNQTELHEPFVGLQKVVEPWYCLVEPGATVNGIQVCSQAGGPAANPAITEPPVLEPTPIGTVIP
jgi:hypothetical protein